MNISSMQLSHAIRPPVSLAALPENGAHAAVSNAQNDALPDPAVDGEPGRQATATLLKQQRRAVKKLVSGLEKLQLEGRSSRRGSWAQGANAAQDYVHELAAGHAKLGEYLDAGLSGDPPPFSGSRSTKNGLALTGGGVSLAISAGTMTAAVASSTAIAVASAPATGVLVGLLCGVEAAVENKSENRLTEFGKMTVMGIGLGAVLPLVGVAAVLGGEGEVSKKWHDRIVKPICNISHMERARDYAFRPRPSTQEIAMDCEERVAAELQRHGSAFQNPRRPARAASTATATSENASSWRFPETEPNADRFNLFQARVAGTREYASLIARPGLIYRMNALVSAMQGSPELRGLCFAIADDALNSCTDRISLGLNDMEAALVSEKAETGQYSMDELYSAGLDKFKLKLLDDIALAKIADLRRLHRSVDEIEVRLVYPTELADRLQLAGVVRSMQYRHCANVTAQEIAAAGNEVRKRVNGSEKIAFIAAWPPWQDALERSHPSDYDRLRQRIASARDALSVPTDAMTDQQWISALNELNQNEQIHLSDLATKLTRRYLSASRNSNRGTVSLG